MFRVVNPVPRAFVPLLQSKRFKGARGGRGGAKSHFVGRLSIEEMFVGHTRLACLRETQTSIKDSVKQLLEDKIAKMEFEDSETGKRYPLAPYFKITEREIVCPRTESLAIFKGLQNHTATSAKSMEGFNRVWYEEAQSLSARSIEIATPTFRTEDSEQIFTWNPDKGFTIGERGRPEGGDPVDMLFADSIEPINTPAGPYGLRKPGEGDADFVCVHVDYCDNPWFPVSLSKDMERDRQRDPEKYGHVWLGGYRRNTDAQVFRNWKVERFDPPAPGTALYFGADWGFTIDPTVLVCCFLVDRTLYVWREAWQIGCGIDQRGALFDRIDPEWGTAKSKEPGWKSIARRYQITADSAEPQTIDYLKRNGFPRIVAAVKGPNSVEEGVTFLQSCDIVVHPDCRHVVDELTLYSYKTDKKSGQVLPELEDKKNHTIDSVRYALESVRRRQSTSISELRI